MIEFGYFKGLPYSNCNDDFEAYRGIKNSVSKAAVIAHIESLAPLLATMGSWDIFSGAEVTAGMYEDGGFRFPTDFLHYYKNYDIGIPPEYEEYLKSIGIEEL